ncbi:hypothetical protein [Legionella maceachernii]|uniref:Transporter n=1 Tax=Legionella maceachernii TaxID=466 RepID=A0A0W0W4C1_9GAMM|nr:hypothetical protein [Legionella maceachernii]KTD27027.1 hypothetical protein Lmac_1275 [Legionella maceachernii]SKA03522.1 hypothetical protein SAMN02745128_01833 [Legionella maceachernii]SUP00185.1 Uncharacterised protein [Legionella maceachernii]
MSRTPKWERLWLIPLICVIASSAFADTNDSPCNGMLAIVNRPTIADSPCTAPNKKFILEFGYEYLNLLEGIQGQSYPFAELRYGLPANNEIFVFFPTYIHLSTRPRSGFSEMAVGYKHELFYTSRMIATLDGSIVPSSGSRAFGSKGWGGVINGIFSFNLSEKLSFTSQLGFSSQTQSVLAGGKRFTSVNPDAFFSWFPVDKLEIYAEIYGQSKTAPDEGSGFNAAAGFIFLPFKNMTIDFEGGQRMRGFLGGVENYVAAGAAIQF